MSGRESIERFRDQYHITFPVGKASGVAKELWVETIPQTVFLTRGGRIARRISGKMSPEELASGIEKILEEF